MANSTVYPYGVGGQLPSSIGLINDLTTGGVNKALTAEMGKTLKGEIDQLGFVFTNQDGFAIVDEELNIGLLVDSYGVHAKNILEYEIVND